ncbi:hypothetical protein E2C01_061038 [Portunus trituberculatus]|uniref:Uncharacterized protein n=1 Tax=Portunus trituberculatus TaxID=210409 RepID=A0A5B7H9P2_PORTR|nr:hypothetical protein [Portunus trituberculatus]
MQSPAPPPKAVCSDTPLPCLDQREVRPKPQLEVHLRKEHVDAAATPFSGSVVALSRRSAC